MQRKTKIAAVVAVLTLVTSGFAVGAPTAGGSIFACLSGNSGTLTKVSTKAPKCPRGTSLISWNRVGLQGERGPAGAAGQAGLNGLNGLTGQQGPQGLMGPMGLQGANGIQGPKGEPGVEGPRGLQGPQGETGAKGIIGEKGDQGVEGPMGPQGEQGSSNPPSLKRFVQTNLGDFPLVNYGTDGVDVNGVFWKCVPVELDSMNVQDSCADNTPNVGAIKSTLWLEYQSLFRDIELTENSIPNTRVFRTSNCTGTSYGYLMSEYRETFTPYAYEEDGEFFLKKKTDLKMNQVNSYSYEGECVANSSPSWSTGSLRVKSKWSDSFWEIDYIFTLVEMAKIEPQNLTFIEVFYEWR